MEKIMFLGGDRRMTAASDIISAEAEVHTAYRGEEQAAEGRYSIIILPMPVSRDGVSINAPLAGGKVPLSEILRYADENAHILCGMAVPSLRELCNKNGLRLSDYCTEELTCRNAFLTAEAALGLLLISLSMSLAGARIIITGGGRIALRLAAMLRGYGAEAIVSARSRTQRSAAEALGCMSIELAELPMYLAGADAVVNTVPFSLFSDSDFVSLREDSVFLELATLPQLPREVQERVRAKYIYGAALPGKYKPTAAGEAIAQEIMNILATE